MTIIILGEDKMKITRRQLKRIIRERVGGGQYASEQKSGQEDQNKDGEKQNRPNTIKLRTEEKLKEHEQQETTRKTMKNLWNNRRHKEETMTQKKKNKMMNTKNAKREKT